MPTFPSELVDSWLAEFAAGAQVKALIRSAGYDPWQFWQYLQENPDVGARYAAALQCRAMMLAEDTVAIADDETVRPDRARNMIAVRQWQASKLDPQRWGERQFIDVTQTIDIGQAMLEARQRVLPIRDQRQVIDVESETISIPYKPTTTDMESVEQEKATESPAPELPDLFD